MIYFVQLASGAVVMGFTDYWQVRLAALRNDHGRVNLLLLLEGDQITEERLYERFAHLQLGATGVFRPGYDLMKFIGQLRATTSWQETGRWIFIPSPGHRAIQHLLTAQGDELNN